MWAREAIRQEISAFQTARLQEKLDEREARRTRGYKLFCALEERRRRILPPIGAEPFLQRSKSPVADMHYLNQSHTLNTSVSLPKIDQLSAVVHDGGKGKIGLPALQMKTSASFSHIPRLRGRTVVLQCTPRTNGACGATTESSRTTSSGVMEWGGGMGSGTFGTAADEAGAPHKARRSRPRRGNIERQASEALRSSTSSEQNTSSSHCGRYVVGRQVDKLLPASMVLLHGLEMWPDAERLQKGFDEVIDSFKLVEAPQRWMEWPFGTQPTEPPRIIEKGDPPGKLQPPFAKTSSPSSMCIAWTGDVAADWHPPEHDDDWYAAQISALSGVAIGYQLEVSEWNALVRPSLACRPHPARE